MGLAHVQLMDGKHAYINREGQSVITYLEEAPKKKEQNGGSLRTTRGS